MKKTLILYATRHGATAEAAQRLAKYFDECDVKNIAKDTVCFEEYDRVLIGSNIRMGTFDRNIRKLLLKDIGVLCEKEVGFFVCCCFTENAAVYFRNNIPPQLLQNAKATAALGGKLERKKLRGIDKCVANMVLKADHARGILHTFSLKNENIADFAKQMQAE